ncbi:DUF916 and DUF3324 domain-containing protein [Lacticaseibacillus pabuli]|uniref:DUF916 and DUF3324 domain-containing protein n=1 Tax=Lacticaseibacillus pabuli TaxID=3025672 RepID=A0ABY7WPY5_9LACO|nr:DUF916 and DUF3324 domain-containing protein [Lacticaseibacillus sp. KACC 23028]WDF81731.1 DUF916 and DUF3324 domain-containing protein [Lacticaseibacillus sp. KACC 23028]
MKKFSLWLAGLVAVIITMVGLHAQATQAATGASFTVAPILTSNQVGMDNGYFNLLLKPGQKQTVAVKVTNLTNKTKNIRVEPINAGTSDNVQVMYDAGVPRDSSAQYRLTDLLDKGVTVKLPASTTQQVKFTLTTPKNGFRGVILGAIHAEDLASYSSGGKGVQVKNRFAMNIGVMAQTSSKQVAPELKMHKVGAHAQSHQAMVTARLQNTQPRMFGKLKIKAKVTRQGRSDAILKQTNTNLSVAPNSHFDYRMISKKALRPGNYTLTLTATSHQWRWHFNRNFSITREQAAKINKEANLKTEIPWMWIIIGVLAAIILILIVLLIVMMRRRKA